MLNPHNVNPPDYASDRYAPARQHFVNDYHISHAQAAQRLLDLWTVQNTLDRQDWDNLQQARAVQECQAQEQLCMEQAKAKHLRLQEEEEEKKKERKKNRAKFLPFANSLSHSTDEDAFALLLDEKGLHLFVPLASARAKQSVIEDHDLTWPQIDEATHHMIQAMKEADWPEERIQALFGFWMNLSTHEWRHDADESACQALITYEATFRRWWHNMLGTTSSFNLKHIDQEALVRIKARIVDQKYQATEKHAREASPTSPPLTNKQLTYPPNLPPCHIPSLPSIPYMLHTTRLSYTPNPPVDWTHYTAFIACGTAFHNTVHPKKALMPPNFAFPTCSPSSPPFHGTPGHR
ncbi:hypothetical protein OG21DRAFT_1487675 [Imleria badia]|nr:hypothetical protein OG21DRAFT_1487675 [Imleria badia]